MFVPFVVFASSDWLKILSMRTFTEASCARALITNSSS